MKTKEIRRGGQEGQDPTSWGTSEVARDVRRFFKEQKGRRLKWRPGNVVLGRL